MLLLEQTSGKEPIVFIDAVQGAMATKVSYGQIKNGTDKLIAKTASRTRVNVMGGVKPKEMRVHSTLLRQSIRKWMPSCFGAKKTAHPPVPQIHVILDQAGYHRSCD